MRTNIFLMPPRFERYLCYPESFGHYVDEASHREHRPAGQLAYYNLHIIRGGQGYIKVGHEYIEMREGSGFLCGPGLEQSYYADEEDPWDIRWIHFQGVGARFLLQGKGEEKAWVFSWRNAEQLDRMWDVLLTLGEPTLQGGEDQISVHLYEMLLYLMQNATDMFSTSMYGHSRKTKLLATAEWIRANCEQSLTIENMADYARYSIGHFCREFHSLLGKSPLDYMTECRVLRAKELLLSTRLPVKTVAERVGFSSSAYFIQRFRQYSGMTPEKFRSLTYES